MSNQMIYQPKEIANLLDIGDSTLRRWCAVLEGAGYTFARTESNARYFIDKDIILLRRVKELVKTRKMALEPAVNVLVSLIEGETQTAPALEVNESTTLQSILLKLEQQEQFNRELLERLDAQQTYIREVLEARDQHLMRPPQEKRSIWKKLLRLT